MQIRSDGTESLQLNNDDGGDVLIGGSAAQGGSNVGIGPMFTGATPAARLDVDGDIIGRGTLTTTGNTEIGGKLHAQWGQVSPSSIDDISGPLGSHGIVENTSGDLIMRAWWGVVIDKAGNNGSAGNYTYGSNPNFNSFAIRTRTSNTAFRTDFYIDPAGLTGIGTTNPQQKLEVAGTIKTTGDVYLTDHTKGIIMKDANNNCWRVTINTNGTFSSTQITCPN